MKRWLEDERDFLVWRGELDARRKEYDKAGEAGSRQQRQALLMGLPLDTAKKWLAARRGDIEPADQAFIEASVRAERAVARNRQRLQAAVGVLMLGTIAGLLGVIFKDEISDLWFEYTTVRRYIAANFTPYVLKPEAERAFKPGDTFRECAKDCPEMVVIPPGEFWMGSPDGEGYASEYPRHKVKIDKPFAVGKFEVTWDDWEACVAMRGCDGRPTGRRWLWKGAPAVDQRVMGSGEGLRGLALADDGQAVPAADRGRMGIRGARGHQRRCAASALSLGRQGKSRIRQLRHGRSAARARPRGGTSGSTRPRWDSFRRMPSGFTTCTAMSGNGSRTPGMTIIVERRPQMAAPGQKVEMQNWRVARGGSWFDSADWLRSAFRYWWLSGSRNVNLGFRVGRTLTSGAGAITVAPGAH